MEYQRVRLQMDYPFVKRCWFLFNPTKCRSVSDLAQLIAKRFEICSGGYQLRMYVEGFLLPPKESIHIVRDNDIIRVTGCESSDTSSSDSDAARVSSFAKRPCTTKARNQALFSSSSSEQSSSTSSSSDSDAPSKQLSTTGGRQGKKQLSSSIKTTAASNADITKPAPPKNKLKRVTTAKSCGGVHIRFQSSSSSSSDSEAPVTRSKPVQTQSKQLAQEKPRKAATSKKRSVVGGANDILEVSSEILVGGKPVNNKPGLGKKRRRRRRSSNNNDNDKSDANNKEGVADDGNTTKEVPLDSESTDVRDYSLCPDLHGPPRQGDKIAFKMLELSESYSPVYSDYKEGVVMSCDPDDNSIVIRWTQHTMKKELEKASKQSTGKFALPQDDEEEANDEDDSSSSNEVKIELSSLITPKLIA